MSGTAALTELGVRVRHWPTPALQQVGHCIRPRLCCSYVVWRIGLPVPGAGSRVSWPTSAVLEAGIVSARTGTYRLVVSWLAGTAPVQACAAGGHVWFTQQGWLVRSDRCLQARGVLARRYCAHTGMCCRRPCMVHPAGGAMYGPPGALVAGLHLLPGLSWT